MRISIIILLMACTVTNIAIGQQNKTEIKKKELITWLKTLRDTVDEAQVESIVLASPMLLSLLGDGKTRNNFIIGLQEAPPVRISWSEASSMIKAGKIIFVSQGHDLTVDIYNHDGHSYVTKEPKIDAILDTIKTVDPKGIFIEYMTE